MKTLGYIFRYNEDEQMGILAFGHKHGPYWEKPILFTKKQCLSPIETGQLVYFDLLDNNTANNIERASFSNFKKNVIEDVVSCYSNKHKNEWYDITHIQFEDISKLKVKEVVIEDSSIEEKNENALDFSCLDLEGLDWDLDFDDEPEQEDPFDYIDSKGYKPISLPEDISSLYNLFGGNKHFSEVRWNNSYYSGKSDTIVVDLLDIENWFDKNMLKDESFYANSLEHILEIFDLFVNKKREAIRYAFNDYNDSISPYWKYILSAISNDDLREICSKEPLLQPALPRKFCFDNINLLTLNYGFPSISVCEQHIRYRANNIKETSEYIYLKDKIEYAIHCTVDHIKEEGIPLCKVKKKVLQECKQLLEKNYYEVVLPSLKNKITLISNKQLNGEKLISNLVNRKDFDYLLKLGIFIDKYEHLLDNCFTFYFIGKFIPLYDGLKDEDKKHFEIPVKKRISECFMKIAEHEIEEKETSSLSYNIKKYSEFINPDTIETIKTKANPVFSNLDDLEKLKDAYDGSFITEEQYLKKYKILTENYTIYQLLKEISGSHLDKKPLLLQDYLLNEIFQKYKQDNSYIYINYQTITSFEGLIAWLNEECQSNNIDYYVLNKKLLNLTNSLSKEERWNLFEKKLIPSPSIDNIREKLDDAFKTKDFDKEYIKEDCFQEIMAGDVVNETNNDKIFMILDNLDTNHKNQAKDKANEQLNFFIWAYSPNENVDWEKIGNYFYLLPYKKQIRLFRFLFYLKATGKTSFSVSELSERLTKSGHKLCIHLQLVLLFLTKKADNLNSHISSNEIKEILGKRNMDLELFFYKNILLSFFSDFFYECHGYLLPSTLKPHTEYYYRNGQVEKVKKDGQVFYVITFYDVQLNYDFERERFASTSPIFEAMDVLERNFPYKRFGDKEYWISADYEYKIKDFVRKFDIDDSCELFDDQDYLFPIHQNWPARHKFCKNILCKRTIECYDIDPIYKIQFCWCEKQPCTRIGLFLEPIDNWQEYKFADLLDILYNMDFSLLNDIWKANAEISHFINKYLLETLESGKEVISNQINLTEEIGEWNDKMSIITDEYPIGYHEDF